MFLKDMISRSTIMSYFFFFNDTATPEIYTLSLHDALPICFDAPRHLQRVGPGEFLDDEEEAGAVVDDRVPDHRLMIEDRKSTRLNSSHVSISYAVFCLKKKKRNTKKKGLIITLNNYRLYIW